MATLCKRKRQALVDKQEKTLVVHKAAEGELSINWGNITTKITKRTVELLKEVKMCAYEKLEQWNVYSGYICWKRVPFHKLLGDLLDNDKAHQR